MECGNDEDLIRMTVEQAISRIMEQCGIDILKSPIKVQAMILDLVKGCEVEKQLFLLACQKGILNYAHRMLSLDDESKKKEVAKEAQKKLQLDAFMSEQNAVHSVNIMLRGLGIDLKLEREDIEKNSFFENEETNSNVRKSIKEDTGEKKLVKDIPKRDVENKLQNLITMAQNDDIEALITLGEWYEYGYYVERDLIIAEVYYRKAEEAGSYEGRRNRERLLLFMENKDLIINEA